MRSKKRDRKCSLGESLGCRQTKRSRFIAASELNSAITQTVSLSGDHSEREPPDPIPNSEVKPFSAYDSVDFHAKVGHRQALILKTPVSLLAGVFFMLIFKNSG